MEMHDALFTSLLRLADDHLILGHRLSEWCGHAPMLEEDLALPNIALDLLGQARALYTYAAEVEGKGRNEDDLAYLRMERDYLNLLICERPNGDFGQTMLRQLGFSIFMHLYWQETAKSSDETLAGIAGKAVKETAYHIRHTGEWVIRLGDGTDESAVRMAHALEALSPYFGEFFEIDETASQMSNAGLLPDPSTLAKAWEAELGPIMQEANLAMPDLSFSQTGGRRGIHTEDMGFLLAELQYMQRSFPGMTW